MKPARSPRFQSAALRASIAVTSACASVSGAGGAGGAAQAATAQSVRDHTPRTGASVDPGERVTKGVKCRGSAVRRWLEPSERRSRGAMCRRLAAPPSRRLLPLGLPAPLRPGFRPLLGGFLLLRLGPRRLPFLRSEEHTSELQSRLHLVCRLLLEKKKKEPTPVQEY